MAGLPCIDVYKFLNSFNVFISIYVVCIIGKLVNSLLSMLGYFVSIYILGAVTNSAAYNLNV